jgi:FtsX-like permease family
VLLSVVDGRPPRRDGEIVLGPATMRAVGARPGGLVRVTVADPDGHPRTSTFRVVGRASFSPSFETGALALGTGSAMSLGALVDAECPPASAIPRCRATILDATRVRILVRADRDRAGAADLARQEHHFAAYFGGPGRVPLELVNFGESVSFPLLFGFALSLFGAATMIHLLLVSVRRRRRETGLLKVLGLLRRQVAAVVSWQATTVAAAGIVVGVPLGIAVGRLAWRAFAVSFGVVPVAVLPAVAVAGVAVAVLAAANLLAFVPALLAARSRPGRLLRTE